MKNRTARLLSKYTIFGIMMLSISAIVSTIVVYAYPRIAERWEYYTVPTNRQLQVNSKNDCEGASSFTLDGKQARIVRIAGKQILPQDFAAIPDLSTVLVVKTPGALDFDLRLEAKHRGEGYSEGLGFGTYVTYQYSKTLNAINRAPVVFPDGWASGINIRDLRDHYGQNIVMNSLALKPGYYKFCVFSSAHSYLSTRDDLAELIVERKFGKRNVLRLSFYPGGEVLH